MNFSKAHFCNNNSLKGPRRIESLVSFSSTNKKFVALAPIRATKRSVILSALTLLVPLVANILQSREVCSIERTKWPCYSPVVLIKTPQGLRGRLQRTSGKWGGGGGFEISDIPGRGEKGESSDVRKFLKKSKFQNFSELFKVKTRNYNRSRFQYESIHM